MIELLMMLMIPQEINPQKLGIKYILKEKFMYYKIDKEEYQVMLTYCKPTKENE